MIRRAAAAPAAVLLLMVAPVTPGHAAGARRLAAGRVSAPVAATNAAGRGIVLMSRAVTRGPDGPTRPGQGDEAFRRVFGAAVRDGRVGAFTALPVPADATGFLAAAAAPDHRPALAVVGSGTVTSVIAWRGSGRRTVLRVPHGPESVFAASDPGGAPVVAWIPAGRDVLTFALERPDGTLSGRRSVPLTGLSTTQAVAVDAAAGRLWITWLQRHGQDSDRLMVRAVPLRASSPGPARELADAGSADVPLHLQATATGAVIGWNATPADGIQAQTPGDPCVATCSVVAVVGPDARARSRLTLPGVGTTALAAGARGAFAAVRHAGGRLGVLRITPLGVIRPEISVAGGPADRVAPDVPSSVTLAPRPSLVIAASHGGGFVLGWATTGRPSALRIAYGAPDGTVAAPLPVTPAGGSVAGIALALGPRPLVLWRAFEGRGQGSSFSATGTAVLAGRALPRPRSCGCTQPQGGGGTS